MSPTNDPSAAGSPAEPQPSTRRRRAIAIHAFAALAVLAGEASVLAARDAHAQTPSPAVVPRPVRVGAPVVRGAMIPEVARRVVRMHLSEWMNCYYTAGRGQPRGPSGEFVVRITVDAEGGVAEAGSAHPDPQVSAVAMCMVTAARRWRFPPPQSGTVVIEQPVVVDASAVRAPASAPQPPPSAPRPTGRK